MKTIAGILGLTILALSAAAQEYDDMYFRKKDREKIKASSTDAYASNYDSFREKHFGETVEKDNNINPTDSYSARQINPEYVSRASSELASADEQNYFIQGYTPAAANTMGYYGNSSFNNGWNNVWYTSGWFGPARFNNWYSPYFGFYDPWMNPFYGFNPGWGFNHFWGPWGSGWNFSIGYSWGNTWCNNFWGPSWSTWNYPYIYYLGGNESTRVTYGKRPSSNSVVPGNVRNHYTSTSVNNNSSGRTRGNDEYYVRPSRRIGNLGTTTNSGESINRSRSYPRNTYTPTQNRSNFYRDSQPAFTPSRNSSFPSGSPRNSSLSSGSRSRGRD